MSPHPLRILLIDDDEDSFVITRALLSRVDGGVFTLDWEESYEAGLTALRRAQHDACLLDYRLGARNGLELLREAIAEGCRAPIILLTSQGDDGIDLQALKAGAGDYLVKGELSDTVLSRAIRYAIERRMAEDQRWLSEAQLLLLTEHLPLALWTTDDQLRFTSSQGGALLGGKTRPNELVGRTLYDHFQAQDVNHPVVAAHQQALRGEDASFEREWGQRTYHAKVVPLRQGENPVKGTIGVALDITDRKQVEEEFRSARRIQQALLPARAPVLAGFDIAGACHPAAATGGDYFDYLYLPDGSLGIVIADVSRHGFAPALIMAGTRRLLRTLAERSSDIGEILTAANRAIAEDTREEHFVTLFFAQLDPGTHTLRFAGAGHEAYVIDEAGEVKRLDSTSPPLGIAEDTVVPRGQPTILQPGQLLVLLTDGIPEAMDCEGKFFGNRRALEIVHAHRSEPAGEIISILYRAVRDFCAPNTHHDDVTAVIVKVQANPTNIV